jgi:hypothetical protein
MQNHLCCLSALHKMKLHAEAERPEGVWGSDAISEGSIIYSDYLCQ